LSKRVQTTQLNNLHLQFYTQKSLWNFVWLFIVSSTNIEVNNSRQGQNIDTSSKRFLRHIRTSKDI
jgi:hypothetical protein